MRHAREDYARIQDPDGKIPDGEPVFLLRAQDKFAPVTLDYYAQQIHQQARGPADHALARLVERQASEMRDWQDLKRVSKFPDAPGVNDEPEPAVSALDASSGPPVKHDED